MHRHADLHTTRDSRRPPVLGDVIEWEELPSLYESLTGRLAAASAAPGSGRVWTETMPAAFDPLTESGPFRETLKGLATREVLEPDVFRHFFGGAATAA